MSTESLAVVATGFSVFALLVAVALAVHVGRLTRGYDALVDGDDRASFVEAVGRHDDVLRSVREDLAGLRDEVTGVRGELARSVRNVAVVRYDAFGDLAGALSFSVAMLDDAGDGLVLTSISGRSETRTYAKDVQGGCSTSPLSPEELDAIAKARR